MKTQNDNQILCDYSVELTTSAGAEIGTAGYCASETEAIERFRESATRLKKEVISIRVLSIECEHAPRSTLLIDLSERMESNGVWRLVDRNGRLAVAEHGGGHMRTAYNYLTSARPDAPWKTIKLMQTFRQAIREDSVNCYTEYLDDMMSRPPTRAGLEAYLRGARVRDEIHHGSNTF